MNPRAALLILALAACCASFPDAQQALATETNASILLAKGGGRDSGERREDSFRHEDRGFDDHRGRGRSRGEDDFPHWEDRDPDDRRGRNDDRFDHRLEVPSSHRGEEWRLRIRDELRLRIEDDHLRLRIDDH